MSALRFIPPALPKTHAGPPRGEPWLHEVKLDGYRVQAHKNGARVTLHSKNGIDFTRRFRVITDAVARLPAVAAILDGEIVALDDEGRPDFRRLHRGERARLAFYAFDLLHLDGADVRAESLTDRKHLLGLQISSLGHPLVREVPGFDDGDRLLAEVERLKLEGVVSKLRHAPYRSGPGCGWLKFKTQAWRADSVDRWRLFQGSP